MEPQKLAVSQVLKYEDFEDLRCNTCKEYLNYPPIMVRLCTDNRPKYYTECGRCFKADAVKEGYSSMLIRNIGAEKLAAVTPFPCRYYKNGCKERRTWPLIEIHEQECMFRIFKCPLFEENPCLFLTGVEIVKKFSEDFPTLILKDGVITQSFNEDFEQSFLIQQNTDLFVCKIRYNAITDSAFYIVTILEDRHNTECNVEFNDENAKQTIILKFKPNPGKQVVIDIKAIKALLCCQSVAVKCRVYLNLKFFALPAADLLKEIQCPSCWDYMRGRIYMCSNGHNICFQCKKGMEFCPVCREVKIQSTRNVSLENVISKAFFPCKNHAQGCSYISTLDETIAHYPSCPFGCDDNDVKTLVA